MFGVQSGPRNLAAALRDLHSERKEVRISAIADLIRHREAHADEVRGGLLEVLQDAESAVRAAAAVALADAQFDDDQTVDALLVCLREDDDEVRQMVLVALGELDAKRAVGGVKKALNDAAAEIRFQAVMAYPRLCDSHTQAVSALLEASRDKDAEVRHIALRMAEELGSSDSDPDDDWSTVDPRILKRARKLLTDRSSSVRLTSAIILGRCGSIDGAKVLVAAVAGKLKDPVAEDVAAAIELCGELSLEEATAALQKRAFGGVPLLRRDPFVWQARVALAALGDDRACRWILAELNGWSREKRTLAVAAAMRAQLQQAKPLLEAMLGKPRRAEQQLVQEALETLAEAQAAASRED